jgi:hypothetical protein
MFFAVWNVIPKTIKLAPIQLIKAWIAGYAFLIVLEP